MQVWSELTDAFVLMLTIMLSEHDRTVCTTWHMLIQETSGIINVSLGEKDVSLFPLTWGLTKVCLCHLGWKINLNVFPSHSCRINLASAVSKSSLNCQIIKIKKLLVERVVCLVCMRWLANDGLSLKSRWHINCSALCTVSLWGWSWLKAQVYTSVCGKITSWPLLPQLSWL